MVCLCRLPHRTRQRQRIYSTPTLEAPIWRPFTPLRGIFWSGVSENHGNPTLRLSHRADGLGEHARQRRAVARRPVQKCGTMGADIRPNWQERG